MKRRAYQIAATCVASFLCIVVLWQSAVSDVWLIRPGFRKNIFGSDFIAVGEDAGDKVLVLAKTANESVDWVLNDLSE